MRILNNKGLVVVRCYTLQLQALYYLYYNLDITNMSIGSELTNLRTLDKKDDGSIDKASARDMLMHIANYAIMTVRELDSEMYSEVNEEPELKLAESLIDVSAL